MNDATGSGSKPLSQQSALELLGALLSPGGGTVPQREIQDNIYAPAVLQVLDPLAEAANQSDPSYLRATLAVEEARNSRMQRPLDRGAAAADVLASRLLAGSRINEILKAVGGPFMRLESNLSGFKSQNQLIYPIAPGVEYRVDYLPSKLPREKGAPVEFIKLEDTPMMDWDTPDPRFHASSSVTVRHLGDVEELVREHLKQNPESLIRLYQTPGGYRAWELGARRTPSEQAPFADAMKVDPHYTRISQQNKNLDVDSVPIARPGFSSRISGKPGRTGDWVAQPLLTLRGDQALPDPVSVERVRRYHDEPIQRAYLGPSGTSSRAMELLGTQALTASQALQKELRRRRLL